MFDEVSGLCKMKICNKCLAHGIDAICAYCDTKGEVKDDPVASEFVNSVLERANKAILDIEPNGKYFGYELQKRLEYIFGKNPVL